jgi:hypothetical protein
MRIRSAALIGVMSLAGLGLIGTGAHAIWTTTTTASQQITSSALSIGLSGPAGSSCNATDPNNGASCINLSLPPYTVNSSSFNSGPITVTMTDNSNVTPNFEKVWLGDTPSGAPGSPGLASETYLCMTSDNQVIWNGPLSEEPAGILVQGAYYLPSPGTPDTYTVEFFAGNVSTLCGNVAPYDPPVAGTNSAAVAAGGLDNSAENGIITPYITMENDG